MKTLVSGSRLGIASHLHSYLVLYMSLRKRLVGDGGRPPIDRLHWTLLHELMGHSVIQRCARLEDLFLDLLSVFSFYFSV